MNRELTMIMMNNFTKHPFLLSIIKGPNQAIGFSLVEESNFNSNQNSFFVFSNVLEDLLSIRFIANSERNKVYIDCDCQMCKTNDLCYFAKIILLNIEDEIDDLGFLGNFKNAEIIYNDLKKNTSEEKPVEELEDAIYESNVEETSELLIRFKFNQLSNASQSPPQNIDWKIIKESYLNRLMQKRPEIALKKKEEIIYVLSCYEGRHSMSSSTRLKLNHFKKTKDKNKLTNDSLRNDEINLSDLKEAKLKLNEAVNFESSLDVFVNEKIRDYLLNRKAGEVREIIGSTFSEFYIYPEFHDLIEKIAIKGKLYFSIMGSSKATKLIWDDQGDKLKFNSLTLNYDEKSSLFELSKPEQSPTINGSKIFKIPGFEIKDNKIYKLIPEEGLLLEQLLKHEEKISINLLELEFFISFLNEQSFFPILHFNNLKLNQLNEVRPQIECKVELGASECSIIPIVKYAEFGFEYNDLRVQHINIEKKINLTRKLSEEVELLTDLSSRIEFDKWNQSLTVIEAHKIIKMLDDQKIPMTYKNKKLNIPKEYSFNASSGIDWVDIKGEVSFGELGIIDIIKLKSALNKGPLIEFKNGEVGLLPNIFAKKYKTILELSSDNKNGSLRINKLHSAFLDTEALDELNITPDSSFEKFIKSFEVLNKSKLKASKTKLSEFKGDLRKYQLEGLNWLEVLSKENHNGILADDMGLGKTVQVIAHLSNLFETAKKNKIDFNSLIVVPKSLLFNWKNEFNKFNPKTSIEIIQTTKDLEKLNDNKNKSKVYVVTYHFLRSKIELFVQHEFDFIILDEAQNIKNENALLTQSVLQLKGRRKLALTGTPIENSLLDLASIFEFLYPGSMTPALKSKLEARGPKKNREDGDEQFLQVFSAFLRPMILRRTKKQVLSDLPPKIEKKVFLEFSEEELKQYDMLKKAIQYSLIAETENKNKSFKILEGILRLRQTCLDCSLINDTKKVKNPGPVGNTRLRSTKINSLIELLQDVLSEGSKAIVFSQFSSFLEIIRTELNHESIKTAYIDGSTKDREGQVNKFKLEKDCQVMLSTLKTGGVGLNLTEAEYVFIMDPWWNPAAENQAIDRAHRIGQSKTVMIYKLIMKDSIEEKVVELQDLKKEVANSVLELGEEGLFKSLSKDEITSLFE